MAIQLTTPSLVAVATGILGSAWASGAIAGFSLFGTSSARAIPQTTAQTWHELYNRGANTMPKVAGTVALLYGYSAYDLYRLGGEWQGFAAAAACVVAIVPWTIVVMHDTNAKLHQAAKGGAEAKSTDVVGLTHKWDKLNMARSLFTFAGAVLGFATLLKTIQ